MLLTHLPYEVAIIVFDHCSIEQLISLWYTSKLLRVEVQAYLKSKFDALSCYEAELNQSPFVTKLKQFINARYNSTLHHLDLSRVAFLIDMIFDVGYYSHLVTFAHTPAIHNQSNLKIISLKAMVISPLYALKSIDLSHNQMTTAQVMAFFYKLNICNINCFKWLNLSYNNIDSYSCLNYANIRNAAVDMSYNALHLNNHEADVLNVASLNINYNGLDKTSIVPKFISHQSPS
ncbi:Hypothetical protein MVR_LOCUS349 [uncultured virus]|nr:Hypothetical protein MVR_LOCUS349 [uncultured virus]